MRTEARVPSPVRAALVILDGLGDRPHPATGGLSPVEAAMTPNLDRLSSEGQLGDVTVIGPGVAPESDAGVLALLGYDPVRDSPGRGVLEAVGEGVPLAPGDVAFRMNFATSDGDGSIVDSRVGRNLTTAESQQLARALTDADLLQERGIRAEVRATVGHRGVLWLHPSPGAPLSANVSNSDPFYDRVGGMGQARQPTDRHPRPVMPLDPDPASVRTADAANAWLTRATPVLLGAAVNGRRAVAGKLLANAVLLRNAGSLSDPPMAPFGPRNGRDGAAVTEMPVERGIARLLGLTDRFVGPMGADRDAALRDRAAVTRQALETFPFVYVHLKGPDEPGHDGDAARKREIIEALDRSFFGPFLQGLDLSTVRVAVTADHATPCAVKGHSDDPVPLLIAGPGFAPRGTRPPTPTKFCERTAAAGPLGHLLGKDVLPRLFSSA